MTLARGGGTPCPIVEDGNGSPLLSTEPCSFTCGVAADAAIAAATAGKIPETVPDVNDAREGGKGGGDGGESKDKNDMGNSGRDTNAREKGVQVMSGQEKHAPGKKENGDKDKAGSREGTKDKDAHDQGVEEKDTEDKSGKAKKGEHKGTTDKSAGKEGKAKDGKEGKAKDGKEGKAKDGKGGGGGGGDVGPDRLEDICVPGSWRPCGEMCEQERYEGEACTGKREVRGR